MNAHELRRRIYQSAQGRLGKSFLDGLAEFELRRLAAKHGVTDSIPEPVQVSTPKPEPELLHPVMETPVQSLPVVDQSFIPPAEKRSFRSKRKFDPSTSP